MLVLRLLMTNGTFELGLHSALESNMPVQRVRPRISIAATWARIAGRIANVRRNSMAPHQWGLVHTVLHSQLPWQRILSSNSQSLVVALCRSSTCRSRKPPCSLPSFDFPPSVVDTRSGIDSTIRSLRLASTSVLENR